MKEEKYCSFCDCIVPNNLFDYGEVIFCDVECYNAYYEKHKMLNSLIKSFNSSTSSYKTISKIDETIRRKYRGSNLWK